MKPLSPSEIETRRRRSPSDLEVSRAIHYNETLRETGCDLDAEADTFIASLSHDEQSDDEISIIDRMIDDNSRDAASAKSEAERRGYRENIERLETERDRLIESTRARAALDEQRDGR